MAMTRIDTERERPIPVVDGELRLSAVRPRPFDPADERVPPSVAEFLRALSMLRAVEALILFGSRRFGDHDDRSDVDVAVCARSLSRDGWSRIQGMADHARTLYRITLVHFDTNPPALRQRILDTGELIYVSTEAGGQLGESGQGSNQPGAGVGDPARPGIDSGGDDPAV